jgi:hypothetical protein
MFIYHCAVFVETTDSTDSGFDEHSLALVISTGGKRYKRVKHLLSYFGLKAIHIPAVFIDKTLNCSGTNGHRLAMRNAWSLIRHTNIAMGVFEDDIIYVENVTTTRKHLNNAIFSIRNHLCDIAFIEDAPGWFRNAAMWISPKGAKQLLDATQNCLDKEGMGVDSMHGDVCTRVKCIRFRKAFRQDRVNIRPYLHDKDNRLIHRSVF